MSDQPETFPVQITQVFRVERTIVDRVPGDDMANAVERQQEEAAPYMKDPRWQESWELMNEDVRPAPETGAPTFPSPGKVFHKHTYTFVLLSEEPLPDGGLDMEDLHRLTHDGPCVGHFIKTHAEFLTPKQAADALYEAGSDPSFFNLDDEGHQCFAVNYAPDDDPSCPEQEEVYAQSQEEAERLFLEDNPGVSIIKTA